MRLAQEEAEEAMRLAAVAAEEATRLAAEEAEDALAKTRREKEEAEEAGAVAGARVRALETQEDETRTALAAARAGRISSPTRGEMMAAREMSTEEALFGKEAGAVLSASAEVEAAVQVEMD